MRRVARTSGYGHSLRKYQLNAQNKRNNNLRIIFFCVCVSLGPHTQVLLKRKQRKRSTSGSVEQYNEVGTQSEGSGSRSPDHEIAPFRFVWKQEYTAVMSPRRAGRNTSGPKNLNRANWTHS